MRNIINDNVVHGRLSENYLTRNILDMKFMVHRSLTVTVCVT